MEKENQSEKPTEEGSVVQERLNWQVAWRDDRKVGQALYAGEPIEEMHHLSDAGLLDEFFVFLKDLGMLEAFEQVSQSGVKRTLVPTVQFVLLYVLKVLLGGESMNELPRVLFSDLALMELVGFNAHQCEKGLTKRGDASRKTKKKQGPITAQCLADNICKINQTTVQKWYKLGLLSGKHAGGQKALWIEWTAEAEVRLGGQASLDPRMTSIKSLCKLQGKTWEQVIRWCVEEGHQIYRLRRGTTFRFYVLPASCSLQP